MERTNRYNEKFETLLNGQNMKEHSEFNVVNRFPCPFCKSGEIVVYKDRGDGISTVDLRYKCSNRCMMGKNE